MKYEVIWYYVNPKSPIVVMYGWEPFAAGEIDGKPVIYARRAWSNDAT